MPYKIKYVKGDSRPWKIVKEGGEIVGTSKTKENAIRSIKARSVGEKKK